MSETNATIGVQMDHPVKLQNPSTLTRAELAVGSTATAFVAGFEAARSGKRAARASKAFTPAERSAFQSGKSHARLPLLKTSEEALRAFLALESLWAGSMVASLREKVESGQVHTIEV